MSSNAKATIESSIISALGDTYHITGLRIDTCQPVIDALMHRIFEPCVVWAVEEYIKERREEANV